MTSICIALRSVRCWWLQRLPAALTTVVSSADADKACQQYIAVAPLNSVFIDRLLPHRNHRQLQTPVERMRLSFQPGVLQVKLCPRLDHHNWKHCPHRHPGEVAAQRRHPSLHKPAFCMNLKLVGSDSSCRHCFCSCSCGRVVVVCAAARLVGAFVMLICRPSVSLYPSRKWLSRPAT